MLCRQESRRAAVILRRLTCAPGAFEGVDIQKERETCELGLLYWPLPRHSLNKVLEPGALGGLAGVWFT